MPSETSIFHVALVGPEAGALAALVLEAGFIPVAAAGEATPGGVDAVVRRAADLPAVLRTLRSAQEARAELSRQAEDLSALAEVTAALAAGGDPEALLASVVSRLAGRLTVERCSMLLLHEGGTGTVIAASDDPAARGTRIDLALYPEIREVMATQKPVLIDDALRHALLDPVRARIEGQGITAIAVIPMACEGVMVGVVFIRSRTRAGFTPREISFMSTVASAAAVSLRNAGRFQKERRQRVAAERALLQLRRYEEFFSHVNDGMAVLDEGGRVLTLNPAGCAILGMSAEEARGLLLPDLVAAESAMEASLLWRELSRGGRVLSADLRVQTRHGRSIVLAVSAGPLRSQNGRAILSFRDVSESRELQSELRKTKEFLERLIDATGDAIVAADLQGNVLLFNRGAERISGHPASEVVGKLSVNDLYPPGQAQDIMRRLRAARAAGQDLPPLRAEIVSRSGEAVPVLVSAALVAQGGEETATVGVFRDLRGELRVEAELQKTRQRLEQAEKTALVSELAGAAAHELNQPLTSVLGFSELLFRRTRENERGREELAAILREAERMAKIVKKIGKITRYETMSYVGKTRIVDLDRASDPPPPSVIIRDKP